MFSNNNTDERGQVGIGTLIVFIAMVLVAAVAAGVLINTAGLLQSQAEATGEQSTAQVSNNIEVFTTVGEVEEDPGDSGETDDGVFVTEVDLLIGLSAGSGAIDLENVVIEWVGPEGSTVLEAGDGVDAGDGEFEIVDVSGTEDGILQDGGDRASIVIPLEDFEGADSGAVGYLGESQDASLTIITEDGSQRHVEISVPNVIDGNVGSQIRL